MRLQAAATAKQFCRGDRGDTYVDHHVFFCRDGKKSGFATVWYQNGQKQWQTVFREGLTNGVWREWYQDGKKKFEANYSDGKLEMHFHVPLKTPLDPRQGQFVLKVYDPEFFIDFEYLNDKPLLHDLQAALARPVRLANDADCFALSEARAGVGREAGAVFGAIFIALLFAFVFIQGGYLLTAIGKR